MPEYGRFIGSESRVVMSNLGNTMSDKQFWDFFKESLQDPESDYSNVAEIVFVLKTEVLGHGLDKREPWRCVAASGSDEIVSNTSLPD